MDAILKLQRKIDFYVPMKSVRNALLLTVVCVGICMPDTSTVFTDSARKGKCPQVSVGHNGIADMNQIAEKTCEEVGGFIRNRELSTTEQSVPWEREEKTTKTTKTIISKTVVANKVATDTVAGMNMTTEHSKVPGKSMDELCANTEKAEVNPANHRMKIVLNGNGGIPETMEYTGTADGFSIDSYEIPIRTGKEFDGWYLDVACTIPFDGILEYQEEVHLYAGWKLLPGFIINDEGYIVGYTEVEHVLKDGLIVLPNDSSCIGLAVDAFAGLDGMVSELYIPANIVKIDAEALKELNNLMYIEVDRKNPVYCSVNGILYEKSGRTIKVPMGR